MNKFFNGNVLLNNETSLKLYEKVKDLPIIDYHCHLDQRKIKNNDTFLDIGELWLSGDHYKWRAMRLCGVDEKYITGNASYEEKFYEYAKIMPKLIKNPLYYWTHFELKEIFGINEPLNERTMKDIYLRANKKLNDLSVRKLLKQFKVEFIATTDDPIDDLSNNGIFDDVIVSPTFRPDKLLKLEDDYLNKLIEVSNTKIQTLDDLKEAIKARLDYFVKRGCRISDHGFNNFPIDIPSDEVANELFNRRHSLNDKEKDMLFGHLLIFLMKEYKKRDMVVQLHFAVTRNINTPMFNKVGVDSGFDVISKEVDYDLLINFLNKLSDEDRPTIILYSLNPNSIAPIAGISGAFRNVLMGAAWWFNDTVGGIERNLDIISEYAVLGTNLGMLTDSRSFASYVRFDFFRRILCNFIGEKVDKGEYDIEDAYKLASDICYYNVKKLLKL